MCQAYRSRMGLKWFQTVIHIQMRRFGLLLVFFKRLHIVRSPFSLTPNSEVATTCFWQQLPIQGHKRLHEPFLRVFTAQPCEHKCSGHGVCEIGGKFGTRFSCNCYRGYSRETCDHAQTACELATSEGRGCQNGAICRETKNPSVIHCDCPNGITGQHCEVVLRSTAEHVSESRHIQFYH